MLISRTTDVRFFEESHLHDMPYRYLLRTPTVQDEEPIDDHTSFFQKLTLCMWSPVDVLSSEEDTRMGLHEGLHAFNDCSSIKENHHMPCQSLSYKVLHRPMVCFTCSAALL